MTILTHSTTTEYKHSSDSLNESGDDSVDVTIAEHLSALFDDEVGSFEQKRVLNELADNDDMRHKLASYSLIGETIRSGKPAATVGMSFLAGIQGQLTDEPVYSEPVLQSASKKSNSQTQTDSQASENKAKNDNSWLRPVGGFAMTASVAALAVIGFQNYMKPSSNSMSPATEIVAATGSTPSSSTVSIASNNKTDAVIKEKLTEAEMESAIVVTADQLDGAGSVDVADTKTYLKADLQTRSLLKRYVDSHMQYASTTTFVPSVRVIAYSDY